MADHLRILVIGGHPADVFDHCGGTMAHHVRAGDSVTCLALTQGLRIHDIVISEKLRFGTSGYSAEEIDKMCAQREQVKYDEVLKACGIFGVTDVRFLRYDDKVLQVTEELITATAKVIRDVRPDIVITHYPFENGGVGSHHANTAKIAMDAMQFAGTVDFDDPNPAWRVAQLFFMSPMETRFFSSFTGYLHAAYCPFYVDITDVVDLKIKALDCIVSQQYEGAYARKRTETMEGLYGHNCGVGYAEAFVPNRPELYHLLPLSDWLRERTNEEEKKTRERGSVMEAYKVEME